MLKDVQGGASCLEGWRDAAPQDVAELKRARPSAHAIGPRTGSGPLPALSSARTAGRRGALASVEARLLVVQRVHSSEKSECAWGKMTGDANRRKLEQLG